MFWTLHSGIIAAIATVFGRYLDYFVPLGLFIIRKRKDVKRAYSVWGYPFVLIGVPVYYLWGRKGSGGKEPERSLITPA